MPVCVPFSELKARVFIDLEIIPIFPLSMFVFQQRYLQVELVSYCYFPISIPALFSAQVCFKKITQLTVVYFNHIYIVLPSATVNLTAEFGQEVDLLSNTISVLV